MLRVLPSFPPQPVETPPEAEQIVTGCHYVLSLEQPALSDGSVGHFRNDLLLPIYTRVVKGYSHASRQPLLRDLFSRVLSDWLEASRRRLRAHADSPLDLLGEITGAWRQFTVSRGCFQFLFAAVFAGPRDHLPAGSPVSQPNLVEQVCIQHFLGHLFNPARDEVAAAIRALVRSARDRFCSDILSSSFLLFSTTPSSSSTIEFSSCVSTLPAALEMLRAIDPSLETYRSLWETQFLASTADYYPTVCSQTLLLAPDFACYHRICDGLLDLEAALLSHLPLDPQARKQHLRCLHDAILSPIQRDPESLQAWLLDCLHTAAVPQLSHAYAFFARLSAAEMLVEHFATTVASFFSRFFLSILPSIGSLDDATYAVGAVDRCSTASASASTAAASVSPTHYCRSFLSLFHETFNLTQAAFFNDRRFIHGLEKAARRSFNNNVHNPAGGSKEFSAVAVARFADQVLGAEEIDETHTGVGGVQLLFDLLASKDVFCRYHKHFLANRLLRHRLTLHRCAEESVMTAAKSSNDPYIAEELSLMCHDIDSSRERYGPDAPFWQQPPEPWSLPCEPLILSHAVWSLASDMSVHLQLPPAIDGPSQAFVQHFEALNPGKTVEWLHERSAVVIELHVSQHHSQYRITVNHFQAALLLVLASQGPLSAPALRERLHLRHDWFQAATKSLLATRLLQFHPVHQSYRINPLFQAPARELSAMLPRYFKAPNSEEVFDAQIEDHRSSLTQLAIVRIMKTRRVINHAELCRETILQTSRIFPQSIERVKRQVDKLLNGCPRYLERGDNRTYKYLNGTEE
ncbi:MAG: cullin [archaeon]|nr:cullin [archaeon]